MNLYLKALVVVVVVVVSMIIIVKLLYKSHETYSPSDGNLLVIDTSGNILLTQNILNDLQTKAQAQTQANQISQQITSLTTQVNNIINGTTPIQNLNVNGLLTLNTNSGYPLRINKTGTDKTAILGYYQNNKLYNGIGIDGNGNPWGGWGKTGWFSNDGFDPQVSL